MRPPRIDVTLGVGETLSTSFLVLGRNLLPFAVLTVLVYAPWLALVFAEPAYAGASEVLPESYAQARTDLAQRALGTALLFGLGMVASAAFCYGTVQYLRRLPATVMDCVRRGLGDLLRVLGTSIVVVLRIAAPITVAILVGMLAEPAVAWLLGPLMLVGGFLSIREAIRLWVAVPAAVMERLGPLQACRRSSTLTSGNRLRIFLLLVVIGLATWLVSFAGALLLMRQEEPRADYASWLLVGTQVLYGVITAVVAAVVYYLLRRKRENVDPERIAAAFG